MNRYAMIDGNGIVRGICIWDGVEPWNPPPGIDIVLQLMPDEACGPGWIYDMSGNPRFTPPPPDA